jgi:hypothetical protein
MSRGRIAAVTAALVLSLTACTSHASSTASVPPVTGFKAIKVSPYTVTLRWDESGGQVVLKRNNRVVLTSANKQSFIDDKVEPGKRYSYTIVAMDGSGQSSVPQTLRVKTSPPPPIVAAGLYGGACTDIAHSPDLSGVHQVDKNRQWHFTLVSADRLKLFSASGGYSMDLTRVGDAKFYGSGSIGGGWERAINLSLRDPDHRGAASSLEGILYDRYSNQSISLFDKASCKMDHT